MEKERPRTRAIRANAPEIRKTNGVYHVAVVAEIGSFAPAARLGCKRGNVSRLHVFYELRVIELLSAPCVALVTTAGVVEVSVAD